MTNRHRWFNTGTLNNAGLFTNHAAGLGMSNEASAVINNQASGTFQNDRVLNNAGSIQNEGLFIINSGFSQGSEVQGTGTFTQTAGETVVLSTLEGSSLDFLGGVLRGNGSVVGPVNIADGAMLSPGNSAGSISVDGTLDLGGALSAELEDISSFDRVDVTGNVSLGATSLLDILPIALYADPTVRGAEDPFALVTAASRNGTFGMVLYDGVTLQADFTSGDGFRDEVGGGLFRTVNYTDTSVEFANLLALAGDTDGDRDIDIFDILNVNIALEGGTLFGLPDTNLGWSGGDMDDDGNTDIFDVLAINVAISGIGGFGKSYATPASSVPEPSTVVLVATGLLALLACGRRMRQAASHGGDDEVHRKSLSDILH